MRRMGKLLSLSVFLMAGLVGLSGAASAHEADCTHSALVKRGDGRFAITLENSCATPVKWSYAACAFGQNLEHDLVTVGPGQTFQANFIYTGLGTPMLKEDSCSGTCVTQLISCSVASTKPSGNEPLLPPEKLFPPKPAEKPSEPELKPLSELMLKEKPAAPSRPVITPAEDVPSSLGAKPLPNGSTIKPLPTLPSAPKASPHVAASCVTTQLLPRNMFGQGQLVVRNICQATQNVAARICVPGNADIQTILSIPDDGSARKAFDLPEGRDVKFRIGKCAGENCTPIMPTSCN